MAEKGVQFSCNTSVNYKLMVSDLAENTKEPNENQSD